MTAAWKKHGVSVTLVAITSMTLGLTAKYLTKTPNASANQALDSRQPARQAASTYRPAKPIIANLGTPSTVWIRLDLAFLMDSSIDENESNILIARISEDTLAFLRTLRMSDLEGPSGLAHLREDLVDRVKVRSDSKVNDVIIRSMILQ